MVVGPANRVRRGDETAASSPLRGTGMPDGVLTVFYARHAPV